MVFLPKKKTNNSKNNTFCHTKKIRFCIKIAAHSSSSEDLPTPEPSSTLYPTTDEDSYTHNNTQKNSTYNTHKHYTQEVTFTVNAHF